MLPNHLGLIYRSKDETIPEEFLVLEETVMNKFVNSWDISSSLVVWSIRQEVDLNAERKQRLQIIYKRGENNPITAISLVSVSQGEEVCLVYFWMVRN